MPKENYVSLQRLLENMQKMPYKIQQNSQEDSYEPVYRENITDTRNRNNYNSLNTPDQSFSELKLNEFRNKKKEKQIQDLALKLIYAQKLNQKSNQTINQTTNKLKSFLEESRELPSLKSVRTQKSMKKRANKSKKYFE